MNFKLLILLLSLSVLSSVSYSQQTQKVIPCHTDEVLEEMIHQNPALLAKQQASDAQIDNWRNSAQKRNSSSCDIRIIPTVVHIVHNNGAENISDLKVQKMLDQANAIWKQENFEMKDLDKIWHDVTANMKVELKLAKVDPDGKPTSGIIRVESSSTVNARDNVKSVSPAWDKNKYLNIWIVRSIQNSSSTGIVLGFAYFPFMETSTTSGIVVRSDVGDNYPSTLAHEMGHYLNLYHPFQGSCGSDCATTGDRVCDTPPRLQSNQNCPLTLNSCNNDSPDQRDMVENIMDYTSCRVMFTIGQKERVDATFQLNRAQLITIDNLYKTGVVDSSYVFGELSAEFSSNVTEVCQGGTVEFYDKSCADINKTSYTWLFPSGTPSVSFERNPKVSYKNSGLYDVTLIIKNNASQIDSLKRTEYIRSESQVSGLKAALYADFETKDEFPYNNWRVTDNFNDVKWEVTNKAASTGVQSLHLYNNSANNSGQIFTVKLPPIDMTTARAMSFSFDVAYARKNSDSDIEDLKVYAIDGCDGFDILRLSQRANSLATVTGYETADFTPEKPSEWKTLTVDLSQFSESTNLKIEIRFSAAGGNNLYLDNFVLGSWPTSIVRQSAEQKINIYPNPTNSNATLSFSSSFNQKATLSVYNAMGQVLESHAINTQVGVNNVELNLAGYNQGVYYIMLETSNERAKQKLVIE